VRRGRAAWSLKAGAPAREERAVCSCKLGALDPPGGRHGHQRCSGGPGDTPGERGRHGWRLLRWSEGRTHRRPVPGTTARGSLGAQVREAVARCGRKSGRAELCGAKLCAAGGRGEAGGMAEHAAGTERSEPGSRGGRLAAARSRLDALWAASTPEPRALPPAPRTYFPAQAEAVVAPGTRDIHAEGSPLRHRSKLAEVRQPRRCPPLPPLPPPPPKRLSHHPGGGGSSPLPRAHSAAAAAGVHAHSAPEPSRLLRGRRPAASPPARPASPGTRERQHAAVPRQAPRPPHWAEGEGRPSPLARPSY
jgi:hypothetical protein